MLPPCHAALCLPILKLGWHHHHPPLGATDNTALCGSSVNSTALGAQSILVPQISADVCTPPLPDACADYCYSTKFVPPSGNHRLRSLLSGAWGT
jgi:hypothetical protein